MDIGFVNERHSLTAGYPIRSDIPPHAWPPVTTGSAARQTPWRWAGRDTRRRPGEGPAAFGVSRSVTTSGQPRAAAMGRVEARAPALRPLTRLLTSAGKRSPSAPRDPAFCLELLGRLVGHLRPHPLVVGSGHDEGDVERRLLADRGLLVGEVGQHRCGLLSGPDRAGPSLLSSKPPGHEAPGEAARARRAGWRSSGAGEALRPAIRCAHCGRPSAPDPRPVLRAAEHDRRVGRARRPRLRRTGAR